MRHTIIICIGLAFVGAGPAGAGEYKVGLAVAVITPTEPAWLGGYASRTQPADGKVHDLRARVLAIEDEAGYSVVLVTMDTENVPRAFADGVADDLHERFGLAREQLVVSCSHTHSGPALAGADAEILYPMTPEQYAVTRRYTAGLRVKLVELTGEALETLAPAELSWGNGRCGFGVNRRNNKEAATGKEGFVPVGPVDHDVPVLCIKSAGELRAVLFGYACHCTTMNFQKWCGDWAGFAILDIEARHPGTTALFTACCGADTNPLPRRKLELCRKYGRQLADSVEHVIAGPMRPVAGPLRAGFKCIDLAFETTPSRQFVEQKLGEGNPLEQRWAKRLQRRLDAGSPLPTRYSYPLQMIRLGDDLNVVVMSGEVVVDYSLRLKKELGRGRTWVFAYCNDVCAYIPSERVLAEGGYEGRDSMVLYGHPSAWAPGLEEKIVRAVHDLAGKLGHPRPKGDGS